MIEPIGASQLLSPAPKAAAPSRVAEAARQFESLLIGEVLKSARSSEGWMGTGDDQAGQSGVAFAEEYMAQAMAAQGGLGIARLVTAGLGEPSES